MNREICHGPCIPRPRPWYLSRQSDIAREFALQSGPLVGAEPADAPRLSDAQALHNLLGADLSDAGHGLQEARYFHLSDNVVGLALLEDLDRKSTRLNSSHLGISYAV